MRSRGMAVLLGLAVAGFAGSADAFLGKVEGLAGGNGPEKAVFEKNQKDAIGAKVLFLEANIDFARATGLKEEYIEKMSQSLSLAKAATDIKELNAAMEGTEEGLAAQRELMEQANELSPEQKTYAAAGYTKMIAGIAVWGGLVAVTAKSVDEITQLADSGPQGKIAAGLLTVPAALLAKTVLTDLPVMMKTFGAAKKLMSTNQMEPSPESKADYEKVLAF